MVWILGVEAVIRFEIRNPYLEWTGHRLLLAERVGSVRFGNGRRRVATYFERICILDGRYF
jgi:hypothetical protein